MACTNLESEDLVLELADRAGLLEAEGQGGLLECADHGGRAAKKELDIRGRLGEPLLHAVSRSLTSWSSVGELTVIMSEVT